MKFKLSIVLVCLLAFLSFFNHTTYAQSISANKGNLSSGIPVQGKLSSSKATDTYKFTTNKDGEVYISLDQTTAGFSLYLYDENGKTITSDSYSSRGSKIVLKEDVQKGTYYVKVSPYSWSGISSATYRLKATYPGNITRNVNTFEPNDTMETSMNINSGQIYKSTSESDIDQDVYQFTTNKDGEVYITLDETTAGYSMNLYDKNGKRIDGDSYSTKGNVIVISDTVEKGTYYIKVNPYEWKGVTSATYRLKATYAGSIKRDVSTFEPNETPDTAMDISSNKYYSSTSYSKSDRDVYKFKVNQDGNTVVQLDNTTGGYSMYLYNEDGKYIGGDSYSSRGKTIVIKENLAKGTYYIKITPYSWSGISSASYRLKATYPSDTTKPDNVKVTVKSKTTNSITLNLSAHDASGIKQYEIYRNNKLVKTVGNVKEYTDTNLQPNTTYTYKIKAFDLSNNVAESGNVLAKTLPKDTIKPDSVKVTVKSKTTNSVTLSLSAHDASGIKQYEIYRNNKLVKTVGNVKEYTDTNLQPNTTYTYKIKAFDPSNNAAESGNVSAKTLPKDTTKPDSVKVAVKLKTTNSVTLSLSAHDASGIKQYEIYRNNKLVKTVGNVKEYTDTNLQPNTTYTYKIKAFDPSNNATESSVINVKTNPKGGLQSGVFVEGKMASSSAGDTYTFTTTKDGEVYITLDQTTAGYSMSLYNQDDEYIAGDSYSTKGNKIVINEDVQKGTYHIKVEPYSWSGISSATYRIKATYAGEISRNPSTFEPNETNETSMSINSGQMYTSTSESNIDQDVYQFTTNKDGEVYISLDQTTAGYSMNLYNQDGEYIAGDSYSSKGSKIVIDEEIQKGTYYVKIKPYEWSGTTSATYRIKATYAGTIKRDTATFEPNETIETAMNIVSGQTYSSSSYSSVDRDVYQFTTKKDGNTKIVLDNTKGGYSMYLYDQYGEYIAGSSYSSAGNVIEINEDLSQGTYYVKVTPYEWSGISSATYRVKATYPK
ncbi:pre-peptidase C-terminal domain-containing protein [Priestia aryabhattai]|uniref:pre-peptidase C-terminal domain-containing protein n=1 Tax=Priestia aryabhattai TaxID=412384 RepID=UPI001C8D86EE|nr:pre-peptidase C-terminal domain-containing protein [Priestia aryabhattai]MBY0063464.1 pre-peptidase C-terminal domain-containing protein [Priestia aryabhattai]